jgi:8-oxo-dGTP pyrophosphatase MutT (NUDIX family)
MLGWILGLIKSLETLVPLIKPIVNVLKFVRNSVYPEPPVNYWIERLNATYPNDVQIHGILNEEPTIELLGSLSISKEEAKISIKYRKNLKVNDPVAVLSEIPIWTDRPLVLRTYTTDFATVCALDEMGKRPTMISANALLFCPDTQELILHRRSEASRDYPGYLHTFGGAYMPPEKQSHDFDHLSLVRTARRETLEESGISFDIGSLPKLLMGYELKIGFAHLALLGVAISKKTLEVAMSNYEGKITRIRKDELPLKLISENWVPAGKAQVLGWLALGAPVGRRRIQFNNLSGQQIFGSVPVTCDDKK